MVTFSIKLLIAVIVDSHAVERNNPEKARYHLHSFLMVISHKTMVQ